MGLVEPESSLTPVIQNADRYEHGSRQHLQGSPCSIRLGSEVATLVDWVAGNVASGVYFYRIQAGDFVATKKLLLLK